MENKTFVEKLNELIEKKDVVGVRQHIEDMHAADVATILEEEPAEEAAMFFRFMTKDKAAHVFSYLSVPRALDLVALFTTSQTASIFDGLYVDDAVDLLEEMPANAVRAVLQTATPQKREQLNRFLKYSDQSAGSVMSAEFIQIYPLMTVREAIDKIRHEKRLLDSFSEVYVTSKDLKLLGVLSVRELLSADDEQNIVDVMHDHVISVTTDTDQEDALDVISRYDFSALPVTDSESRIVGIITADDALDISEQAASEDFQIMAAINPNNKEYFDTSVWDMAKSRLPWLLFLMLSGMLNGLILGSFENAFLTLPILVTFIPMLTDTGGNTGAQSSTLIIRGLATGDIDRKDAPRVLWKEFRVALCVGLVLGLLSFLRVALFPPNDPVVGIVVGLAVMTIVLFSKLLGGMLPLLAERIGVDPALMAAPLITTIIDASGLIVFFLLAKAILHL